MASTSIFGARGVFGANDAMVSQRPWTFGCHSVGSDFDSGAGFFGAFMVE